MDGQGDMSPLNIQYYQDLLSNDDSDKRTAVSPVSPYSQVPPLTRYPAGSPHFSPGPRSTQPLTTFSYMPQMSPSSTSFHTSLAQVQRSSPSVSRPPMCPSQSSSSLSGSLFRRDSFNHSNHGPRSVMQPAPILSSLQPSPVYYSCPPAPMFSSQQLSPVYYSCPQVTDQPSLLFSSQQLSPVYYSCPQVTDQPSPVFSSQQSSPVYYSCSQITQPEPVFSSSLMHSSFTPETQPAPVYPSYSQVTQPAPGYSPFTPIDLAPVYSSFTPGTQPAPDDSSFTLVTQPALDNSSFLQPTPENSSFTPVTQLEPGNSSFMPVTQPEPENFSVAPVTQLEPGNSSFSPVTQPAPENSSFTPVTQLEPGNSSLSPMTRPASDNSSFTLVTQHEPFNSSFTPVTELSSSSVLVSLPSSTVCSLVPSLTHSPSLSLGKPPRYPTSPSAQVQKKDSSNEFNQNPSPLQTAPVSSSLPPSSVYSSLPPKYPTSPSSHVGNSSWSSRKPPRVPVKASTTNSMSASGSNTQPRKKSHKRTDSGINSRILPPLPDLMKEGAVEWTYDNNGSNEFMILDNTNHNDASRSGSENGSHSEGGSNDNENRFKTGPTTSGVKRKAGKDIDPFYQRVPVDGCFNDMIKQKSRSPAARNLRNLPVAEKRQHTSSGLRIASDISEVESPEAKRKRRILANRAAAARSKQRKDLHTLNMENKKKALESQHDTMSRKVADLEKENMMMTYENKEMNIRIFFREREEQFRDEISKLKAALALHGQASVVDDAQRLKEPLALNGQASVDDDTQRRLKEASAMNKQLCAEIKLLKLAAGETLYQQVKPNEAQVEGSNMQQPQDQNMKQPLDQNMQQPLEQNMQQLQDQNIFQQLNINQFNQVNEFNQQQSNFGLDKQT